MQHTKKVVTQKILDYISGQRNKGVADDVIRSALLLANWPQPDIDQAFQYLQQNIPAPQVTPQNKKVDESKIYDTKKGSITWLVVAVVSLFIIPYMAYASLSMSVLGLFFSIKNKSGWGRVTIYVLTIIISILSLFLKALFASRN